MARKIIQLTNPSGAFAAPVEAKPTDTPLMRQYAALKAKHPGTLLLFRIGDFYETFGEDAEQTAKILGIVLTKRSNGAASDVALAGFPHHALNTYLPKLVKAGQRVAVCDQLEDPKLAKGLVKRGVTDIVTPGIVLEEGLLEGNRSNYLAAIQYEHGKAGLRVAVAFVDVSTGDFFCTDGDPPALERLLFALRPAEVVVSRTDYRDFHSAYPSDFVTTRLEDWHFVAAAAHAQLLQHFAVATLKGFGFEGNELGLTPAGVLLLYLGENEQKNLGHLRRLYALPSDTYVQLDRFTLRNLEIFAPTSPEGKSLVDVVDRTTTAAGARLLRRWLAFPLKQMEPLRVRQARVAALVQAVQLRTDLERRLKPLADLERLAGRLATQRLGPREAKSLQTTLEAIPGLWQAVAALPEFAAEAEYAGATHEAAALLANTLAPDCPPQLGTGGVIREGISAELDELRSLKADSELRLEQMRVREVARTGINSLKISYNRVFGYYIEIGHAHQAKVPSDYLRKQTLANAERYITPELKAFEDKILTAEEKIAAIEAAQFAALVQRLQPHLGPIQEAAARLAGLDVAVGLAALATERGYCRPELLAPGLLDITAGRHPVVETLLPRDSPYVPNDLLLDPASRQILLITGPNMAGKSALLRQTALIVLLAQIGSYVPAQAARIGLVDKIFTRVGAADNLSAGESTFMVEMLESARILHTATPESLVLLDEVGRGTSTYDGVSIAWALVEYLHNHAPSAAKTLFATHYHELAELAGRLPRVHNAQVSVREVEGKVVFLRKLQPGHSAHSFGIQVAALAGMPAQVVERARTLLAQLEAQRGSPSQATKALPGPRSPAAQLPLFAQPDETTARIRRLLAEADLERMTPIEALLKLQEVKALVDKADKKVK